MEDLRFRRVWLAVFLVVILALIAGLVMKIRQADRRPAAGPPPKH